MSEPLAGGTLIGARYRILDPIGHGGMGEVYKARDESLDRRVALKLMYGGSGLPELGERFRREARALARISHPNAVAVHDFGLHGNRPYIVMELLEGFDLQALTQQGPLPPLLVRAIAAGMCEGLRAAHEAGVLHRDIKPSNVHLTRQGRVVLQDFGIAAMLIGDTSDATLTRTGHIIGTPQFMPPESVLSAPVGPAADLYSVGACLYVMLAGEMPFASDTAFAAMYRIVNEGVPDIRKAVPGLPPDLADLVMELVRSAASERPTVDETIARLNCPPDADAMIASVATSGVRDRALAGLRDQDGLASPGALPGTARPSPSSTYVVPELAAEQAQRAAPSATPPEYRVALSQVTREHILRAMTPETAQTRLREAVGLVLRGELAEAGQLLSAVHSVCGSTLGAGHPTTLAARYWHGVCLSRLGAAGEALAAFATVSEAMPRAVTARREQTTTDGAAPTSGDS
ncbi:serine/threonine-protein kinase [Streptomyces sp. NPDC059900]|uniref:serine/threonine-protein kinase n=1 Tax=Streptomyces sp. NPDC059900 TaxID=3155816 RepID=UPI00341CFB59